MRPSGERVVAKSLEDYCQVAIRADGRDALGNPFRTRKGVARVFHPELRQRNKIAIRLMFIEPQRDAAAGRPNVAQMGVEKRVARSGHSDAALESLGFVTGFV